MNIRGLLIGGVLGGICANTYGAIVGAVLGCFFIETCPKQQILLPEGFPLSKKKRMFIVSMLWQFF